MPKANLLFFAILRDQVGQARMEWEFPTGLRVAELKLQLEVKYSQAAPALKRCLVSINREFAFDEDAIPDGAEVGFFPPVSGGGEAHTIISVTNDLIDLNNLLSQITTPRNGAACIFTGMVRGITERGDPHQTDVLYYEAYIPMAEEKMRQVAAEIRQRWPEVEGIALVQRTGRLEPTTPTVMIACTAAHRDTGVFEAARYGIDRLKEIVPVWKKEIGPGGEEWVEGTYHPTEEDR